MAVRPRSPLLTVVLSLLVSLLAADPGVAQPPDDLETTGHQHGEEGGHLPASSANVELVGRLDLTGVANGISDVAALGNYAYLGTFNAECAGRPGAQGTGVHVVDVGDPWAPAKVAFIPSHPNTWAGEGVFVMHVATESFTGDLLLHSNEPCDPAQPYIGGTSIWDVTDPTNPVLLVAGAGDSTPPAPNTPTHAIHSVQGWTTGPRAYAALVDTFETQDVDILDITDPRQPVLVSERGLEDWPEAQRPLAHGEVVNHHDMQVKKLRGHWYMLVSYWDAGQILLNVDDPANPVFVNDSNYPTPDTLTGFPVAEGNSHQSYWSSNNRWILATDEDFSPFRTLFRMTTGPNAGEYGAGEFSWTVPMAERFPAGFAGPTVFGGSGCEEDANGNGTSDRAEVPPASTLPADDGEARTVVFSRGVCFFSTKVESGQLAGYDAVIIGNSHGGSRSGLVPDAFACGAPGHQFTVTVSAFCLGHRAMHLLFDDPPAYTGPEGFAAGGDLPAIGTVGQRVTASSAFDGWGYVRLLDAATLEERGAYAVPEALDPAYARGFGVLSVHEVKTDPRRGVNLAYLSYYDAGLRVVRFGRRGIEEVGHYVAEGGNDFWGVFPLQLRGRGRPYLLMSDRDSGLWIFRYTGRP